MLHSARFLNFTFPARDLEVILICFLEYFGADFHCSNWNTGIHHWHFDRNRRFGIQYTNNGYSRAAVSWWLGACFRTVQVLAKLYRRCGIFLFFCSHTSMADSYSRYSTRSSVLMILIFKLQLFCLVPRPIFLSNTKLSMLILRMKEFNCLLFCIAKFFYWVNFCTFNKERRRFCWYDVSEETSYQRKKSNEVIHLERKNQYSSAWSSVGAGRFRGIQTREKL